MAPLPSNRTGLALVLLGAAALAGCAARSPRHAAAADACLRSFDTKYCAFEVVQLKLSRSRDFHGILTSEGGDPAQRGPQWPDVTVTVRVKAIQRPEVERTTQANTETGAFALSGLPDGDYCYQVEVQPFGWECVTGLLHVRAGAPAREVHIEVPLGK